MTSQTFPRPDELADVPNLVNHHAVLGRHDRAIKRSGTRQLRAYEYTRQIAHRQSELEKEHSFHVSASLKAYEQILDARARARGGTYTVALLVGGGVLFAMIRQGWSVEAICGVVTGLAAIAIQVQSRLAVLAGNKVAPPSAPLAVGEPRRPFPSLHSWTDDDEDTKPGADGARKDE